MKKPPMSLPLLLILLTACPAASGTGDPAAPAPSTPTAGAPADLDVASAMVAPPPTPAGGTGQGGALRAAYEEAYDNLEGGDWYRDRDNESAALAWGQSWVMMSLAAMYRATADPLYLERLAYQIEGVLEQRDDRRKVADYRGVSGACWRNLSYQPGGEPYCYAVHSGMIAYPMVEFARLVREQGLEDHLGPGGRRFGDLAPAFVAAAAETAAYHDDQWREEGAYAFRVDATFFDHPGSLVPLNMSSAMGRLLLALHDVTGERVYLERARAIARRFEAQITVAGDAAYLWNYGGGRYVPFGEDFSHASISVDFAVMAARRNLVFDAADLRGFAATFVQRVYVHDGALAHRIGGGAQVGGQERSQCARWLRLSPAEPRLWAVVRDVYATVYPPEEVRTGGTLISWAYLAEFEPPPCAGIKRGEGWGDGGDWRTATGSSATISLRPADAARACVWSLDLDAGRRVEVQRWDGEAYRDLAIWQPTKGETVRQLPYDPAWAEGLEDGAVRYRLEISGRAKGGVRVRMREESGGGGGTGAGTGG